MTWCDSSFFSVCLTPSKCLSPSFFFSPWKQSVNHSLQEKLITKEGLRIYVIIWVTVTLQSSLLHLWTLALSLKLFDRRLKFTGALTSIKHYSNVDAVYFSKSRLNPIALRTLNCSYSWTSSVSWTKIRIGLCFLGLLNKHWVTCSRVSRCGVGAASCAFCLAVRLVNLNTHGQQ